jgi:hypothetical protein
VLDQGGVLRSGRVRCGPFRREQALPQEIQDFSVKRRIARSIPVRNNRLGYI